MELKKIFNFSNYFFLLFLIFFQFSCCKKDYDILSKIEKSSTEEIDLFLIPHKYNILESDWLLKKTKSTFNKKDLIRYLSEHGRYISDLRKNPEAEYAEKEGIITLKVGKTSHSTDYSYDKKIPIIFYGKKWFNRGVYPDKITQQKIVPTLSKILKTSNPNGVKEQAITHILKEINDLPEIVVTIVIDQGGQQLYKAHPFASPNITALKTQSAYFPNAEVGHLDAHTAVGHAAIGTGAYPKENGVIGNTFFTMENGILKKSEIYSTDENIINASELKSETLADLVDLHYGNKPEIISQAYALRASIGMGGHGSFPFGNLKGSDKDYIYWLNANDCKWTTDEKIYLLPEFAKDFSPCNHFLKNYPNGWKEIHDFKFEDSRKYWSYLMATPKETELESNLFQKMIEEKIILKGKANDQIPDLAYMTIKSTDSAGHYFGFESLEAEATFQEADKQVGIILEFLKKNFGEKFILILTADHGCAPLPEISGGERLLIEDVFKIVDSLLISKNASSESLIEKMTVGQISLNKKVMKKYNITEDEIIEKILSIKVKEKKFFKKIYKKKDILQG